VQPGCVAVTEGRVRWEEFDGLFPGGESCYTARGKGQRPNRQRPCYIEKRGSRSVPLKPSMRMFVMQKTVVMLRNRCLKARAWRNTTRYGGKQSQHG